jgi:hypothetical protein
MAKRILKISLYSAVIIVAGAPVGAAAAFDADRTALGGWPPLSLRRRPVRARNLY